MKRITKVSLFLTILLITLSCNDNTFDTTLVSKTNTKLIEDETFLKNRFSVALANVFCESEASREFIKQEALKQFDYEYDVLYMLIKDRVIENNQTFEDLLLRFMSKDELTSLLKKIPNLTIFIPALPEDFFSPETWNTQKEIPLVAYMNNNKQILYTDNIGTINTIESDEIPAFPIAVVKPSERVFLQTSSTRNSDSSILTAQNGTNFIFTHKEFDNTNPTSKMQTRGVSTDYPEKLKKIYEAKDYADKNGIWQRDYIYYNISKKDGSGIFQKNISECIYYFELSGDPNNMYRLIADQGDDPHYSEYEVKVPKDPRDSGRRDYALSFWFEGNFEFIVKIYVSNTQLISNEIIKAISISPNDLFELNIENINTGRHQIKKRAIGIKNLKKYYLPNPLPLFDWNIEHYSSSIKISIEEKDNEVTEQKLIETTSNFASNFEFNIGLGETIKKGAKFGASASTTQKVSTTITTHLDSEQLGDVIINFGDDIVIKNEMDAVVSGVPGRASYKTTYRPVLNPKYTSGYYKIEVLPLALY